MDLQSRFRINTPNVVSETIDGEVIVINLISGNYYSLENVGAAIWAWMDQGATLNEIVNWLPAIYACEGQNLSSAVDAFILQLRSENLIAPESANGKNAAAPQAVEEKRPFHTPVLNTFSDMQDLLLLDPIHEVDETGWPRQKPNGNG